MASKASFRVLAVAGIAVLSGAAWWYQNKASVADAGGKTTPAAGAPAPGASGPAAGGGGKPSVEVARVEVTRLVDDTQAVGSLRSRQGVMVRPEVSGRITQLNFRDGERVRKGQVLVQFDDQLPAAQVQQALAELSIAKANHKRNQELVAQNFISQRSLDESAAALQVSEAKLSLAKASAARLKIVAPFDGIAGIRLVNVGDYLKDGSDIVNLEDIDAIFVDYRLPERFQAKLRRGQSAEVSLDALPGRKFPATVTAVDPLIDANGRSVGVRGCIDNRRLQLRPGMFARVNTVFGQRDNARVIPEEAIIPQGGKQFVVRLVDGPDGQSRVSQRVEVKVGLRSPGKVEIVQGLEAGDTVVTTGQQRVTKDGTAVRVVDLAEKGPRPGASAAAGSPAAASSAAQPKAEGASAAGAGSDKPPGLAASSALDRPAAPQAAGKDGHGDKGGKSGSAAAAPAGPDPCLALLGAGAKPGAKPAGSGDQRQSEGASGAAPERKLTAPVSVPVQGPA